MKDLWASGGFSKVDVIGDAADLGGIVLSTLSLQTEAPAAPFENGASFSLAVVGAFRQGKANNCGSVAVAKTAIAIFGAASIGGVFTEVHVANDVYEIKLRNGETTKVTSRQVSTAANQSRFTLLQYDGAAQQIFAQANFLYAVMAVRAPLVGTGSVGWNA